MYLICRDTQSDKYFEVGTYDSSLSRFREQRGNSDFETMYDVPDQYAHMDSQYQYQPVLLSKKV